MISASTQCADVGWYSKIEPGSQFSRQLANFSTRPSRVHCCGGPSGAYGNPEVCSITCSTVMTSLPFVANSGMKSVTSWCSSTSPSAITIQKADATKALVAENTTKRVSSVASPKRLEDLELAVPRDRDLTGR